VGIGFPLNFRDVFEVVRVVGLDVRGSHAFEIVQWAALLQPS
jgi:hypothetical protein